MVMISMLLIVTEENVPTMAIGLHGDLVQQHAEEDRDHIFEDASMELLVILDVKDQHVRKNHAINKTVQFGRFGENGVIALRNVTEDTDHVKEHVFVEKLVKMDVLDQLLIRSSVIFSDVPTILNGQVTAHVMYHAEVVLK